MTSSRRRSTRAASAGSLRVARLGRWAQTGSGQSSIEPGTPRSSALGRGSPIGSADVDSRQSGMATAIASALSAEYIGAQSTRAPTTALRSARRQQMSRPRHRRGGYSKQRWSGVVVSARRCCRRASEQIVCIARGSVEIMRGATPTRRAAAASRARRAGWHGAL